MRKHGRAPRLLALIYGLHMFYLDQKYAMFTPVSRDPE